MKDWKKTEYTDTFKKLVDNFNDNSDNSSFLDSLNSNLLSSGVLYSGNETIDGVLINSTDPINQTGENTLKYGVVNSNTVLDNFKLYFRTTNNIVELNLFPVDLRSYNDGKLHFLFIKEDLSYRVSDSMFGSVDEILLFRFSIDTDSTWYQLYVMAQRGGVPLYSGQDEFYEVKDLITVPYSGFPSSYRLRLAYTDGEIKRGGLNFSSKNNPDLKKLNEIDYIPIIYPDLYNNVIYPTKTVTTSGWNKYVDYDFNYDIITDKYMTYDSNIRYKTEILDLINRIKNYLYYIKDYTNAKADELHNDIVLGVSNDILHQELKDYLFFIDTILSLVIDIMHIWIDSDGYFNSINSKFNSISNFTAVVYTYLNQNLYDGDLENTITESQVTYMRELVSYFIEDDITIYASPLSDLLDSLKTGLDSITTTVGTLDTVPTGKYTVQRILYDVYMNCYIVQYGDTVYDTYAEAVAGTDQLNYPMPNENNLIFIPVAVLVVKSGITSIVDTADTIIIPKRSTNVMAFNNENIDYVARTWALSQIPTGSIIGFEGSTNPPGYEEYEPNGKILKAYTLFTGSTTGNVTLSANISNYNYIEIYYTYSNFKGCIKFLGTTQSAVLNGMNFASNEYIQIFEEVISISGTTITRGTSHGKNISNSNNTVGNWSGSINIIKVVGYKEV